MAPPNIMASIAAILKLSNDVLRCLSNGKDALEGRRQCALELINLYSILYQLDFRQQKAPASLRWFAIVRKLTVENEPLDQFEEALEMLQDKLTKEGRLKQVDEVLVRKFKKEEFATSLGLMQRLTIQFEIALQVDH